MTEDSSIHEELAEARARLRERGWTEADLAAFDRRHVARWGANGELRHLLALYRILPPMPPVGARADGDVDERTLAKVRALLAKAESTTFPAEAEALSAKAQELMTRYRIDGVQLAGEGDPGPSGRRVWIDQPYIGPKVALLRAVARANSCRAIEIGSDGCVHLVGHARDLEAVELLFTSLLLQGIECHGTRWVTRRCGRSVANPVLPAATCCRCSPSGE